MSDAHLLYDAKTWARPGDVHAIFARLRAEDPVHFCRHDSYPDLWHVTRHADIFEIERRTDAFLNKPRLIINSSQREAGLRALTGGGLSLIQSLVTMDPPEHPKMRLLTQAWFMPKNLASLQSTIEESATEGLRRLIDASGPIDFAREVATEFPLRVIMSVLGVPASDYRLMLRLTQELFGPEDPDARRKDVAADDPVAALRRTFAEFAAYFRALSEARRASPKDDVASVIANAKIDGQPISDEAALGYYIIIATAGHDTTSYSLSEAVYHLAQSPNLFARLRKAPDELAPRIAEEAIRFASPVRHFIRTAATDVDVRGKRIRAGESLILWYPSGSRDEEVFPNPDRFDPDRDLSVRHAAFGHAAHMCLGMHLARQEITTFLKLLASNVLAIEAAGDAAYSQANFVSGIKRLPVRVRVSA